MMITTRWSQTWPGPGFAVNRLGCAPSTPTTMNPDNHTLTLHCRLAGQLKEDCRLLEELRVMDYSLLLGIHFRSPDYGSTPQATDKVSV